MMRWPAAEIDWEARSPPWRDPACPEDGESVSTLEESATRLRYLRPLSGSSVIIFVLDHGAHGEILGLQQVRRGRNLYRLGDLSDFKREVQTDGLLHLDLDAVGGSDTETRVLHLDVVNAGWDGGERVVAVTRGHGAAEAFVAIFTRVTLAPATAALRRP